MRCAQCRMPQLPHHNHHAQHHIPHLTCCMLRTVLRKLRVAQRLPRGAQCMLHSAYLASLRIPHVADRCPLAVHGRLLAAHGRSLIVCRMPHMACRRQPAVVLFPRATCRSLPIACCRLRTCVSLRAACRLSPAAGWLPLMAGCLPPAVHGRCLPHIAHCTLHTAHCTLRIIHCTLHVVPCTLHIASLAASRRLPAFRRLLLMAGRLSRMVGCVPRMACCLLLAAGRRLIAAYCSWPHPAGRQLLAACSFLMAAGCWSPMAHHPPPTAHHQQPGTGRSPLPTCLWSRTTNGLPHVVCRELAHPSCALVRPSCALAYPSCAVACRIYIAA